MKRATTTLIAAATLLIFDGSAAARHPAGQASMGKGHVRPANGRHRLNRYNKRRIPQNQRQVVKRRADALVKRVVWSDGGAVSLDLRGLSRREHKAVLTSVAREALRLKITPAATDSPSRFTVRQ